MKLFSFLAAAIGVAICLTGVTLGIIHEAPIMTFGVSIPGALVTILWTIIFVWEVKHGN
jgi:hypothetical protein